MKHLLDMSSEGWLSDLKGLWSLCWRMVLLMPVIMLFGTLILLVVTVMPFLVLYAIFEISMGEYYQALAAAALWLLWLRFRDRLNKFAFQNWDPMGL